ncbi:MAG TPA: SH3 domain-containing protein [Phototrophicaceae bacterium]|nr:SH3 domain-containing protein [Phototrophicaceae bacterium]
MVLLLAAAGIGFTLLFVGNTLLQLLRRRPVVGFVQTLLAFLAGLLPVAALVANQLQAAPLPLVSQLIPVNIGLLVLTGLIALVVELRRPERLKSSRAVFSLGLAALVGLAALTTPFTAETLLLTPTPFVLPTASYTPAASATANQPVTITPTPTLTATVTRTPRPTASPTPPIFSTFTPTPTATLPEPCSAVANYNLNLRAAPALEAAVLAAIPYNSFLTAYGKNADASWWYIRYEGQAGWVNGEFLTLAADCGALPVRPAD